MLYAFNSGDLEKFRKYEKRWITLPNFKESKELLEGKIRLLCLMEVGVANPASTRISNIPSIIPPIHPDGHDQTAETPLPLLR